MKPTSVVTSEYVMLVSVCKTDFFSLYVLMIWSCQTMYARE
jgi:hypothetical protein